MPNLQVMHIFNFASKKPIIVIFISWFVFQLLLFLMFGITETHEAERFINNASILLNDHQLGEFQLFYSFYISIIAIDLFFTKSLLPIIFLQLSLNLFSTLLFFRILKRLLNNNIALWTTIIMIVSYPLQQWNFYIYSESIFISELIIILYLLLNLSYQKVISFLLLALVYIITFFTRPSAVYLTIPVLIFFIINYKMYNRNKLSALLFFLIVTMLAALSFRYNYFYLKEFTSEALDKNWIIYGYENIKISGKSENTLLYFFEIISKRFIYYFGMIRPYYSKIHNILLLLYSFIIYFLAVIGIFNFTGFKRSINIFILLVIAAFSLATILTFINWHGRFIAPIIPFILIMAAIGYHIIERKLKSKKMT